MLPELICISIHIVGNVDNSSIYSYSYTLDAASLGISCSNVICLAYGSLQGTNADGQDQQINKHYRSNFNTKQKTDNCRNTAIDHTNYKPHQYLTTKIFIVYA